MLVFRGVNWEKSAETPQESSATASGILSQRQRVESQQVGGEDLAWKKQQQRWQRIMVRMYIHTCGIFWHTQLSKAMKPTSSLFSPPALRGGGRTRQAFGSGARIYPSPGGWHLWWSSVTLVQKTFWGKEIHRARLREGCADVFYFFFWCPFSIGGICGIVSRRDL